MTPPEVLARARAGDVAALSANIRSMNADVESFVVKGEDSSALEIVGRVWRAWIMSGSVEAGAAAAKGALDASGDSLDVWRARALYGDGLIAFRQGDNQRSRSRNEELLELAPRIEDVRGECDGLTGLARLALRASDYGAVVELAREARLKARAAADREAEAAPMHLEAAGLRLDNRYDEARRTYQDRPELSERLAKPPVAAMEQHNLGWVEIHRGAVDAAAGWVRRRDASTVHDAYAN